MIQLLVYGGLVSLFGYIFASSIINVLGEWPEAKPHIILGARTGISAIVALASAIRIASILITGE